jgi:hypothetical protein
MPPIAAAVGAIGTAITGAGSAIIGAGTSALGGLTTAGAGAISGIGGIIEAGKEAAPKVLGIAKTGSEIIGLFETPDQPTGPQPIRTPATQPQRGVVPTNLLNTLPNLIRSPQQQILTTPAPTRTTENKFIKYLPIAAVIIGFLILRQ